MSETKDSCEKCAYTYGSFGCCSMEDGKMEYHCLEGYNLYAEEHAKPPLGIIPKYIWDTKRMAAILDAMERYSNAQKPIPTNWVLELRTLVNSEMFCSDRGIEEVENE